VAKPNHIILCGGAPAPRGVTPDQIVRLDLGGDEPNVDLEIVDISRRLSSDVPDVLTDLIEIASYVYCADQAVTRGGEGVIAFGGHWRRNFVFHIPVRLPSIWSSPSVLDVLQKTLAILSEDTYEFRFAQRINAVPMQQYLKLGDGDSTTQELDEVLLFSGGVDSLGGTVQEAVLDKRRVALVSHRSNSKVFSRQKQLIGGLHAICKQNPPVHVPVWVHQSGTDGREYTQRSRTFLYASLAAAVAHVFGLKHIRFYENGVVGLNLPISEQVVGARATRTTHPQVLDGFARLFSNLVQQPFAVENPFLWVTKTEVVNLIGDAGCSHLIEQSVSCMHTHEQTKEKPHCGRCSQCISRKFATLASRYPLSDPDTIYKANLLTAERFKGEHPKTGDLTLVESFIRTATDVGLMNDFQIVEHYGEISRVLRHVRPLSADQVAEKVIQLYRRHSSDVTKVMDEAFRAHVSDIREEKLPATCAILLAIPESYKTIGVDDRRESPGAQVDSSAPTGTGGGPPSQAGSVEEGREDARHGVPNLTEMKIPEWLGGAARSKTAKQRPPPKGSLDRPSQTDPVWMIKVDQKGPIPVTRLSGKVDWISTSPTTEADDAVLTPEHERSIAEVTLSGRSELRSEIEKVFGGPDWPPASAIVDPFRRYATNVFDVNAAAYQAVAPTQAKDSHEVLNAMLRNLLSEVFGREWESSPGERVTRTDWQQGTDGWKGKEVVAIAGNDPDPTCEYHQLISDAIKYRYRFHAVLPAPIPGEPPGINLSNVEWWQYIGLNERHNLAMAIKPYLEDRKAHWQSICASRRPTDSSNGTESQLQTAAGLSGSVPEGNAASRPQRKRGRPTEIPDERKQRALAVRGGKARAQILYATKYPTPQQVKNVSSILKHYCGKGTPKQG
jgi:Queuosine biosynthesis protein QueC